MKRRHFSQQALSLFAGSFFASRLWGADRLQATPSQNRGPFYPIPEIEKQEFWDFDLTCKNENSPVAEGEIILVRGSVVNLDDRPLDKVFVEVWQACNSGRYNHPNDKGISPMDHNFQYWGRLQTSDDGSYAFKTIQPGKYPGRTPHIHFRVVAPSRATLETQLYFDANEALNRKDGVYSGVPKEQQRNVTTGLELLPINSKNPSSDKILTGNFKIVLGPERDRKSTPGM